MEDVNCSNKTALNIISELEEVGLIEKYRQGLGRPIRFMSRILLSQKCNFIICQKDKSRIFTFDN